MAGLPHETTVVIERRVTLGRAPDSDIQLNDPEVSRRHAKIEVDAAGVATLVDLASTAGTYVDAVRIDRHPLVPGEVIAIGRFRLRFEEVSEAVADQRPAPKHGMEVLRPTTRLEPGVGASPSTRTRPPPAPRQGSTTSATRQMAAVTAAPREDTSRIVVPVVARLAARAIPRAPRNALAFDEPAFAAESGVPQIVDDRATLPPPQPAASPGERDPLVIRSETMAVVRAVFDYRHLRLAQLAHEILDHDELARLDDLQHQLEHGLGEHDDPNSQRRFRRFGCAVPALLVHHDGRRLSGTPIALEDISAGGAQACITDVLAAGLPCWLAVDLEDDRPNPVVVFGARVVWSLPDDHRVGLVFSGGVRAGVDAMTLVRAEAGVD